MESQPKRFWSEGAGSFAIAVVLALIIRWAFLEAYIIPSGSMLPSLLINDHIFVNKVVYGVRVPFTTDWLAQFANPRRGDVIVFHYPSDPDLYYIKRVIGVPGDEILYENGNLYINQQLIEREVPTGAVKNDWDFLSDNDFVGDLNAGGLSNYSHWQETLDAKSYSILLKQNGSRQLEFGPFGPVPKDHYFVMGDNRDNSQDSRFWASLATAALGKVSVSQVGTSETSVSVPKGAIIVAESDDGKKVMLQTTEEVSISSETRDVAVTALELGPAGNLPPGAVKFFENEKLKGSLNVQNSSPIVGGIDKKYVPREYIVGRAMFVWLSCEERLPVVDFLCNPLTIRWSRIFHSIH